MMYYIWWLIIEIWGEIQTSVRLQEVHDKGNQLSQETEDIQGLGQKESQYYEHIHHQLGIQLQRQLLYECERSECV